MPGCVQPTHVQLINTYKVLPFKKNNYFNNFLIVQIFFLISKLDTENFLLASTFFHA